MKFDQKITVIFKFVCYICWQFQPFWIAALYLTDEKILECSWIFYYSKKWIKKTVLSFV